MINYSSGAKFGSNSKDYINRSKVRLGRCTEEKWPYLTEPVQVHGSRKITDYCIIQLPPFIFFSSPSLLSLTCSLIQPLLIMFSCFLLSPLEGLSFTFLWFLSFSYLSPCPPSLSLSSIYGSLIKITHLMKKGSIVLFSVILPRLWARLANIGREKSWLHCRKRSHRV